MATAVSQAWNSLQSGRIDDAREGFRQAIDAQSDRQTGYLGLAATAVAAGDLRDGLSFAQKSLEAGPSAEAHLLAGELHSRLGNRRQAEQHLDQYFRAGGNAAYARALIGEQRIRTARWDEGLEDYLRALSTDVDGRARRQFKRVMSDLSKVVAEGHLPAPPAREFVDQLDQKLAQPPPDLQKFFGTIRRALANGEALSGPPSGNPVLDVLDKRQLPSSTSSATGPSSSSETGPAPTREEASAPETGREAAREESSEIAGIDPKQKDLAGVIQQDRRENEQLQEAIGAMPPPDWPSDPDYGTIDPLPRMAWKRQSIFAGDPGMDATDFRITSGSVRAEIFLERCLQNLLAGASQDRAVTVRFRPEEITRIEVNCWDGLLERLPAMSGIYEEFHESGDYGMLAVGRFLGECVATPYDGTWDFADPPDESSLIIGETTLDPFGFARRWREASDVDSVHLEKLADQARRAARDSSSLTVEQNYIDPTRELEGQSLGVKLAELWASYLFRLADASFSDLAETIEPLEIDPSLIVFSLDPSYCPDLAVGPEGGAILEGGKVAVGYRRDTGQFLLMASRKHAARAAASRFGELSGETAPEIARFLAKFHRPRWQFAGDESAASRLASRTGADLGPPRLAATDGGQSLQIDAVANGKPVRLVVRAPAGGSEFDWRIELESQA